jgi:hypothetical protein
MKNTDTEIPVSKKVGTHHYSLVFMARVVYLTLSVLIITGNQTGSE